MVNCWCIYNHNYTFVQVNEAYNVWENAGWKWPDSTAVSVARGRQRPQMIHRDTSFVLACFVKSTGEAMTLASRWQMSGVNENSVCHLVAGCDSSKPQLDLKWQRWQEKQWTAFLCFMSFWFWLHQHVLTGGEKKLTPQSEMTSSSAFFLCSSVFKWIERLNPWAAAD